MHSGTYRPRAGWPAAVALVAMTYMAQAGTVRPVDCASPLRSDEKVICANDGLKRLDAEIAELDNRLAALLPKNDEMARRDLRNSRYRFVKFRRLCSRDVACQKRAHEHRLKWLREQIARHEKAK